MKRTGALDDAGGIDPVRRVEQAAPEAGGDGEVLALEIHLHPLDRNPDAFRYLEQDGFVAVDDEDAEFLATEAGGHVLGADGFLYRSRDGAQDFVAGKMSPGIVEVLEMVDVDHEEARPLAVPRHARDFLLEASHEEVMVVQPGFYRR